MRSSQKYWKTQAFTRKDVIAKKVDARKSTANATKAVSYAPINAFVMGAKIAMNTRKFLN